MTYHRKAAGKIKFPTHPNPGGADPEQVRKLNEASAAEAYGVILERTREGSGTEVTTPNRTPQNNE